MGFWHVLICHFLWASFTLLNIYYLIQKSNNSNAVTFLWLCSLCRVITCDECLKAHWTQLESLAGEKMIKMILTCLSSSPRAIVEIFHCQDHSNRISNLKAFNYKIKSFQASKNNWNVISACLHTHSFIHLVNKLEPDKAFPIKLVVIFFTCVYSPFENVHCRLGVIQLAKILTCKMICGNTKPMYQTGGHYFISVYFPRGQIETQRKKTKEFWASPTCDWWVPFWSLVWQGLLEHFCVHWCFVLNPQAWLQLLGEYKKGKLFV